MLAQGVGLAINVGFEGLINVDYLLKIQLLKVYIQPPDKKIHHIPLLQLRRPHRSQRFQYIAHLSIKRVKVIQIGHTLAILLEEVDVVDDGKHLCLEGLVGALSAGLLV